MASKLIRSIIATAIALTWYAASPPQPVQAASHFDAAPARLHHFKFYLDPALAADMEFVRLVLPKYVSDMNAVLAKNTNRQLVFDAQTDIMISSQKPETDTAPSPLPVNGFDLWAYAVPSGSRVSYGGFATVDVGGAGVVANLHWARIYDPDNLSAGDLPDYCGQLSVLLHELAHVFGAGIGEYYSLSHISDSTQAEPLLNIDSTDPRDAYWNDKPDFMVDPLLRLTRAASRAEYLLKVRYSDLTAAVISGDYRNGVPSFNRFTVRVVDERAAPVPGAQVKVWNVAAKAPYASLLLLDARTDTNGEVTLSWGGMGSPHTATNILRLIKVYRDGLPIAPPRYVSIFDADIAQFVDGQSSLTLVMQPADQPPTEITLSSTSLDENQPAGAFVGELAAVDPDASDTLSFGFCGGADDAAFQISGRELFSRLSLDYEIRSSYNICLRADDGRGGTLDRAFVIGVNDLPDTVTATFASSAINDGWVLESGAGSNMGGTLDRSSAAFLVGNDALKRRYRSVLSFNTAGLPDHCIVTRATLKIRKQAMTTANPFSTLGRLVADVTGPYIGSAAALQQTDFQARVDLSAAGIFGTSPDPAGWYSANLKVAALGQVNPNGATQFRIRYTGPAAAGADYLALYSGNAAWTNRPVLTVEYELP